jgi:peptidyl-prolyl cis-trans isomerase SurA
MKRFWLWGSLCAGLLLAGPAEGVLVDRIVAVVNGEVVTYSELQQARQVQGLLAPGQTAGKGSDQIDRELLREIIETRLLIQEAKRQGLSVSDEELKLALSDIKQRNRMDDAALVAALAREGLTLEEYRRQLGEQMLIARIVEKEVRSRAVVTQGDLEAYYREHREPYRLPEEITLSHLFFPLPKGADAEARARVQSEVEQALQALKQGGDFRALARRSGGDDGRLGTFTKGSLAPEFEKAIASLREGGISQPVWSGDGVHILRVDEWRTERFRPLDEVKGEIEKVLLPRKVDELRVKWIKRIRANAFIDIRL